MTITVIGHGYVGLVSASVFAELGNKVWVIGHTPEKLERLRNGDPIIYEPKLADVLKKNNEAGRLIFTDKYDQAIKESSIVFIAVGTPPAADGSADLSVVYEVAKKIGENLGDQFTVVAGKSTVPVGTNLEVERIMKQANPEANVAVASCPEFLREGSALQDTRVPDRVVIGSNSKEAIDQLLELHKDLPGKRVTTNLASSEMIKYASNSILATKISFANLISFYCEKTGADVEEVLEAVGMDKRIGRTFMYAGIGYGGSCFPKDVQALADTGKKIDINTGLLDTVESINQHARANFLDHILEKVSGKNIAILGLAFKPDTDDIRFAPSVYLIEQLLEKGYNIKAYDPAAMDNIKGKFGDKITLTQTALETVKDADALLILTEWGEFVNIDLSKVKSLLKTPLLFDGRNIFDPKKMKDMGFTYVGVGRA